MKLLRNLENVTLRKYYVESKLSLITENCSHPMLFQKGNTLITRICPFSKLILRTFDLRYSAENFQYLPYGKT